ncbi:MAG: hypothetical protein KUL83_04155 [Lentimicrobium sp.]|jgi:hypothetical protein|nr:hypothetical protein [Lentimicrobium sp.]MDD2526633.1 hypothetical protein [Lentimicrobiaceae bacterium]MDD4596817.1 hypothetical protein [Lentimicrobiaceae bacterium]MDY0025324.1 hypothetical protein [Lentimicrobium sp.]HAH60337.1 transglycosylase [Bacteroidales bacterium]
MKIVGIILFIIGVVGMIVFGIQAINDSESISLFGLDITLSKANWTPIIISALFVLIGAVIGFAGKSKS